MTFSRLQVTTISVSG